MNFLVSPSKCKKDNLERNANKFMPLKIVFNFVPTNAKMDSSRIYVVSLRLLVFALQL